MNKTVRYATLTVARNEFESIGNTLSLILDQTIPPNHLVLVYDGSTDHTLDILLSLEDWYKFSDDILPSMPANWRNTSYKVVVRKDRGFSALNSYNLYLLADAYNSGLRYLKDKKDWDWLVIIPADCKLSESYIEYVLHGMTNVYGVASGSPTRHKEYEKYKEGQPTGGGMVINRKILDYMGGLYPRNNDYESSVIHCARFLGFEIGRFESVEYGRKRLSGSKESQPFISWGRGMKDANYHPLYVIGRIFKELIFNHNFNKGSKLLVGYLAQPSHDYPDYSIFLRQYQQFSIKNGITRILRKLRLL